MTIVPRNLRSADNNATSAGSGESILMESTVHLLRRQPRGAVGVAVAMVAAGALGGILFHSAVFAALGCLLILGASAEYLLPIHYKLTTRRACAYYGLARLEIEWKRVRRVDEGTGAVKLSPFTIPNRMDGLRGIMLRFDEADHAAIMTIVRNHAAAMQGYLDGETTGG